MRTALAGVSFLALLPAISPVAAQTTLSEPPADRTEEPAVADIVVTAQKRSERLNSVPMSITALSGDQLAQRGIVGPDDLPKLATGLVFSKSAYSTPVYTLRGIGFADYALGATPAVSVYVDQAPLPYSQMAEFAALDVERVEVLKGPQGTLFGMNATGGAVNYIAAKPSATFVGGASLGSSQYGGLDASAYVGGPITENLRFRVSGMTEQGGAWQRSLSRDDKLGDRNKSAARLLLDWTPTDNFQVGLNLNIGINKSETQAAQFRAVTPLNPINTILRNSRPQLFNYPVAPSDPRAADWDPGTDFRNNNLNKQAVLTMSYDVRDWLTVKSLTSYQHFKARNRFDGDGTALQAFDGIIDGKLRTIYQEFGLYGNHVNGVKWIIGGNYGDDIVDQYQIGLRPASSRGVNNIAQSANLSYQTARSWSVYGNADVPITSELKIQGGIRYTNSRRNFTGCLATVDAAGSAFYAAFFRIASFPIGGCYTIARNGLPLQLISSSLHEDNISWRIGPTWQVNRDVLLYANVSRGYKSGAYPLIGATYYQQLDPVTQESVLAYEVGFKAAIARTIQLNGAGFYYDYQDKQVRGRVFDPVLGALSSLVNVPKSTVWGAEASVVWRPVRGVTIDGGATYLKTEIKGNFVNLDFLGVSQTLTGQQLPFSPHWSANGNATYEWTLTKNLVGTAGAGVVHQSRSNAGLGEVPIANLRAWTTLDLRAAISAQDKSWQASIWARNVTNTYYWNSVIQIIDVIARYASPPRTIGATVNVRY